MAALEDGRACFGKGDKKEKLFHHDVIQIGNREDFGVTDSDFDVHYWRELKKSGKLDAASKYVLEHLNKDGNVKPGRLYHLRTLRGFYDECQSNNNRMKQHTLETLYKRVCDEMDDFEMKYSTEFEVNASGNVIADWLETVPDEAFKVQSRPRF